MNMPQNGEQSSCLPERGQIVHAINDKSRLAIPLGIERKKGTPRHIAVVDQNGRIHAENPAV